MKRKGRADRAMRPIAIRADVNCWAEGSAEISMGRTKLFCTASLSETTPGWLNRPGQGWVTAEYAMLPRSGDFRSSRERGYNSGRSQEISRLIGRSLRSALDLQKLGERQIYIDCDVLQADGGTRCAAVNGGFIALARALKELKDRSIIKEIPLKNYVSAVSLGLFKDEIYVDLDLQEDKSCDADVNFVMNDQGRFIEIQGTAEKQSWTAEQMTEMMEAAKKACFSIIEKQRAAAEVKIASS